MDWVIAAANPINLDPLFYLFYIELLLLAALIDRGCEDGTGGILDSAINVLVGIALFHWTQN